MNIFDRLQQEGIYKKALLHREEERAEIIKKYIERDD